MDQILNLASICLIIGLSPSMFSDDQIIAIMTYMIMLLVISIIAASLFLYLPNPSKRHEIICLRYFCGYFWVSSLSYVAFILSGAEILPLIFATFLNNGLAITAPYFLYFGLNWHYKTSTHLHQNRLILFHILGASTLISLIAAVVDNSLILVELVFFPNLFIAFFAAYKVLLNNISQYPNPGEKLFKRTFQFSFFAMAIMLSIIVITENFFIYTGGIMIMQGIMTVGFLSAVYFSYLYRVINKLRKLSITDPLTKLFNRRYFLAQANTVIRSAGRDKQPMCLIMCDLDYFKKINDQYGHEAGDSALIAFADILKTTLREQDTVARIGGEEFIILLPNTNLDLVAKISERLRANTEALSIKTSTDTIKITASFGICLIDPARSVESNIRLVDETLYTAKSKGRNRVEFGNFAMSI